MVPVSRKGKGSKGASATPVAVGKDVLDALLPAVTGRAAGAQLLERWRHKQAPGGHQMAAGRTRVVAIAERGHAPVAGHPGTREHARRHPLRAAAFSIVRGIRAGLPIRLVAAVHDTSVQMIERHYSRWIVDGLDELAARAVVPLVPQDAGKVVRMRGRT